MLSETTGAFFRTTRWTLLGRLRLKPGPERDEALGAVIRDYWPPVYAFLRRSGCGRDEAAEVTQAFFADVVLGRRLLENADPARGRARALVCAALKKYRIDRARRSAARTRRVVNVAEHELDREERLLASGGGPSPEDAFDRRWALAALERALAACEAHYRARGLGRNWEAYAARELHPRIGSCRPVPPAQLARELGFETAADVCAAVQTVKRKLEVLLHEEAGAGLPDAEAQRAEYLRMRALLGG